MRIAYVSRAGKFWQVRIDGIAWNAFRALDDCLAWCNREGYTVKL